MPNLADELSRIHRVVTRAITVARERGRGFAEAGFPDATMRRGYVDYVGCLLALVHTHHDSEEELVFPHLRSRMTALPIEQLEAQHRELVTALDRAQEELDAARWSELVHTLDGIDAAWRAHIAIEESAFSPAAVDAALDADAQATLLRTVGEHAQRKVSSPELALPFVLYNLEPADRAILAATLPPPVRNLIEGPWRAQWAPMRAFLLAD